MTTPGLYPGMTRAEYDAIDAINQSRLKKGVGISPWHFKWTLDNPTEPSGDMRFGNAFHLYALEHDVFQATVHECKYDIKSDAKDAVKCRQDHPDKLCISKGDLSVLREMHESLCTAKRAWNLLRHPAAVECSMVWSMDGVLCKGRADKIIEENNIGIVDLKTTRGDRLYPGYYDRQIVDCGYDFQGAFYIDGYFSLTGKVLPMRHIVVSKAPPYEVAIYTITNDFIARGRKLYADVLKVYAKGTLTGEWPRCCDGGNYFANPPGYVMHEVEDQFEQPKGAGNDQAA